MKTILNILGVLSILVISSCSKINHLDDLHCFGTDKSCPTDSLVINDKITLDQCYILDGVNTENPIVPTNARVKDSVEIPIEVVGINSGVTGMVLFVTGHSNNIHEVKSFMQYDNCNIHAQVLTPIKVNYIFVPKTEGLHQFVFINLYGEATKFAINVTK